MPEGKKISLVGQFYERISDEVETPINDPNIERINPTERTADPSMFDIKGCELVGRRIATEIKFVSRRALK